MKTFLLMAVLLALPVQSGGLFAQGGGQPPFIFTAYGGLFFPSNPHFQQVYGSSSDLIWGVGVSLPLQSSIFLAADVGFFHTESFLDPGRDSTTALSERFIHVGIIDKLPLAGALFLRLSGGFNYVTVTQTVTGSVSGEQSADADKKIGYYAGLGIEHFIEGSHLSFFADGIYDYRRSDQKELYGDFGGTRFVIGAHIYMF